MHKTGKKVKVKLVKAHRGKKKSVKKVWKREREKSNERRLEKTKENIKIQCEGVKVMIGKERITIENGFKKE